ncbi:MAG: 2-dehydropantoate 2-reductase [Nitrospinota bacterium]|nr:2-dehydropantoate 2-reductase [Nitrospinota bacterium]
MKILILGSGAVGGYFGAKLAKGGNTLYFSARGRQLEALRTSGLHIESIGGNFDIQTMASERFDPIEDLDLILVCVKVGDTRAILPQIKEQTGKDTVVISLQNGVDSVDMLKEAVAEDKIMEGIAFIGSNLYEPGRIRHTASGSVTIGELNGKNSERAERIRKVFEDAGVECRISSKIQNAKWEKLVWNAGFNGLAAITGASVGKILSFEPTRNIVISLMREVVDVAQKSGIDIRQNSIDRHISVSEKMDDVIPSMLQDVRADRKTEIEFINGKIVREGMRIGVPVPYNELIWASVSMIDKRRESRT